MKSQVSTHETELQQESKLVVVEQQSEGGV